MIAEYVVEGVGVFPAGVAYTHPTMGYRTVNLGFGMESMMGDRAGDGFFEPGASDRVDLMENIMHYFGIMVHETAIDDPDRIAVTSLAPASPNPFNPLTTVRYSTASRGHAVIRIYDVAGRLVRTLVDGEVDAGEHAAIWDGRSDSGDRAASGVYFVRMETHGFRAVRKAVLLK